MNRVNYLVKSRARLKEPGITEIIEQRNLNTADEITTKIGYLTKIRGEPYYKAFYMTLADAEATQLQGAYSSRSQAAHAILREYHAHNLVSCNQ